MNIIIPWSKSFEGRLTDAMNVWGVNNRIYVLALETDDVTPGFEVLRVPKSGNTIHINFLEGPGVVVANGGPTALTVAATTLALDNDYALFDLQRDGMTQLLD